MQSISRLVVILTTVATVFGVFGVAVASAQNPASEPYRPTKLEWAAVELQALHGENSMTHESPIMVTFVPWKGESLLCVLQYTADVSAAVIKIKRDAIRQAFELYRDSRGWSWLKLSFQERPGDKRWPAN